MDPPAGSARHDHNPHQFRGIFSLRYIRSAMNPESVLRRKKNAIQEICRRHGATNIRIFGSVARHTAGETSDIDFLVDLEPGRTLFDLGGLAYDLEKLLGRHVDVATPGLLRSRIRDRIMEEAVPL